MALLQKVANAYGQLATSKPLFTNCVTGFVIASIGDIVCQRYIEKQLKGRHVDEKLASNKTNKPPPALWKWDMKRTFEMGVIRAAVVAPFMQFWYPFVSGLFKRNTIGNMIGRVCIDQAFGSPAVISLVFLSSSILQGNPLDFLKRMKETFITTWIKGLQYWPFIHTITFSLIPPIHRSLWAHVCSLYWNAVLSYYANLTME
jgi:hypothetical protein